MRIKSRALLKNCMTLIGRIVVGDLVLDEFDREDIEAHNLSQIENV